MGKNIEGNKRGMFLCNRLEKEFCSDKWRVCKRGHGKMVPVVGWIGASMKEKSFMLFVSFVFVDICFVLQTSRGL